MKHSIAQELIKLIGLHEIIQEESKNKKKRKNQKEYLEKIVGEIETYLKIRFGSFFFIPSQQLQEINLYDYIHETVYDVLVPSEESLEIRLKSEVTLSDKDIYNLKIKVERNKNKEVEAIKIHTISLANHRLLIEDISFSGTTNKAKTTSSFYDASSVLYLWEKIVENHHSPSLENFELALEKYHIEPDYLVEGEFSKKWSSILEQSAELDCSKITVTPPTEFQKEYKFVEKSLISTTFYVIETEQIEEKLENKKHKYQIIKKG